MRLGLVLAAFAGLGLDLVGVPAASGLVATMILGSIGVLVATLAVPKAAAGPAPSC